MGGGPLEVIGKLPKRYRLEGKVEERLFAKRPDAALLVDNGEINLRLASLLHFFKVPVVYYIPPKVWVWRPGRLEDIALHCAKVLSILPFEKPIYEEWGIPFDYVGNPLLDELPLALTAPEARRRLGIEGDRPAVAVLPGSRHSEIRFHTGVFTEALARFAAETKALPEALRDPLFLVPIPPSVDFDAVSKGFTGLDFRFFRGMSHECLKASRAALIKSGTSTLEAGVLGTPMVIAYQSGKLARFIFHHIMRYRHHVGMVNLFLAPEGPAVVEELILERCTPEQLSRGLMDVYVDGEKRSRQLKELARALDLLKPPSRLGASPSAAVAGALYKAAQEKAQPIGFPV